MGAMKTALDVTLCKLFPYYKELIYLWLALSQLSQGNFEAKQDVYTYIKIPFLLKYSKQY